MNRKVLLYIDDDPEDMEFFREAVRMVDPSCQCIGARNGQEGLEVLATLSPDLILLDINMPVMDGKETLKLIQVDNRLNKLPVFMLSTTTNPREREVFRKLGAKACLIKPNSFDALCDIVRNFLQEVPAENLQRGGYT
jgi:CheY-like chemotaxis protein